MSRLSLSPKLVVKSPRNTVVPNSIQEKLPNIKDHKSAIPLKQSHSKPEDSNSKSSPRVINFFDMPTPINQKKVDLVRTVLDRRNLTCLPNREDQKLEESSNKIRDEFLDCRTELDLQARFLKEKGCGRKTQGVVDKIKAFSHSIEFDKLGVPNDKNGMKSESVADINSFQNDRKSEDFFDSCEKNDNRVEDDEKIERNEKPGIFVFKSLDVDMDQLLKENSELKKLLSEANNEIVQLKQEKKSLLANFEHSAMQSKEFKLILESQIKVLHEEIELKSQDCEILKDQVKKSEFARKKFIEAIKDLEVDLTITKKKADHSRKDLENLEIKYGALESELNVEKRKIVLLEDLNREVEKLNYELSLMKAEKEEIFIEKCVARESLETVRKNFDNFRLAWRDKEVKFEEIIENLLEQIQAEKGKNSYQAAETAKLRKALTLKDNESFNSFTKDELSRFYGKMVQIDKENGELLIEIDNFKKNIEYYKLLIRNKEEVILKISEENQELRKKDEKVKEGFTERSLEGVRKTIKEWMSCSKCLNGVSMSIIVPCKHLACSKCEPEDGNCPACNLSVSSIQMFTEFSKVREIYLLFEKLSAF